MVRNIPTYVGKTLTDRRIPSDIWEHPHMRGEDLCEQYDHDSIEGTSPLAWGRLLQVAPPRRKSGNIPTYVGKTLRKLSKIKDLTFSKVPNLLPFKAQNTAKSSLFYSSVKERPMWNVTLIAQKKEPSKNSTMKDGTHNQCKCVSKPLIELDAYYGEIVLCLIRYHPPHGNLFLYFF